MVEIEIDRDAEIKGDRVLMHTKAKEEMSIDEFKSTYSHRSSELHQIQAQLDALLVELRKYDGLQETKEDKELKDKLVKANKLIRKDEIIEQVKKFEKKQIDTKKELEKLSPLINRLRGDSK